MKVALAVLGIFLIKCSTAKSRLLVGDVFLGLSVSTMLGDSLLHILPSVLGELNYNLELNQFLFDQGFTNMEAERKVTMITVTMITVMVTKDMTMNTQNTC